MLKNYQIDKKNSLYKLSSSTFLVFVVFTITLFSLNFVSSVPPVTTTQQFSNGYVIEDSPQVYIKQGTNLSYNFFLYNLSTGALLDNSSILCYHYLLDSEGNVTSFNEVTYVLEGLYWQLNLDKGNFSDVGLYYYGTRCNSTGMGGAVTGAWEVTLSGIGVDTSRSLLYIGLLGIFVFMFIISIGAISLLPSKNNYDPEGTLISINQLKYIRPILWAFSYLLVLAIMYISSNIAMAFSGTSFIGELLFKIFQVMGWMMIPMLFIFFIYILVSAVQDGILKKYIERGAFE